MGLVFITQIPKFNLISWWKNFVETHSYQEILIFWTKFPQKDYFIYY